MRATAAIEAAMIGAAVTAVPMVFKPVRAPLLSAAAAAAAVVVLVETGVFRVGVARVAWRAACVSVTT
jgi:hypothetical protein